MKRPEGFDPEPEPRKAPRAAQRTVKQEPVRRAERSQPTRGVANRRAEHAIGSPDESSPSTRELRRFGRERRAVERREARRFTKRSRTRRAVWLSVFGILGVIFGLLAVAVFSPLLSFERLEVRGAVAVDEAAVRAIVEEQLGTPLALLDHEAIRVGLSGIALIRSYTTEVTPPNTLTVHVVEREPVGVLRTESGFAVVDAAGVVLSRAEERPDGLPRINVDAEGASGLGFAAVVEVLLALPPALRSDVDSALATTRDDVRLTLRGGGEAVVWGSADRSELKARVLESLLAARPGGEGLEFDVSAPLSPVIRSR